MTIQIKEKYVGFYRLLVHRNGKLRKDTGWFPNLITDQGMDWIGSGPPNFNVSYGQQFICTHCGVGTGNTPPQFADTHLTSFLSMFPATSGSNVEGFSTTSYVAGPPAYWSGVFVYSFAEGAVVGNIAEVGTGNTASSDTQPQLFSHALILDGGGNPTTIPLTSTDSLTVNYELRMYLDLTDNNYSISISGVNYSGVYRRALIGNVPNYAYTLGYNINGTSFGASLIYFNGSIQDVNMEPTGTSQGGGNLVSTSKATYTPGSYFVSFSSIVTGPNGNLSGGISAIMTDCCHGNYQFSVSPSIPKTSSFTLTINWNVSWSRY